MVEIIPANKKRATAAVAFAKAECANYQPDGTCLMLEASILHRGQGLSLPPWLPPERWGALVAEAGARGQATITIYRDRQQWHEDKAERVISVGLSCR